MRKFIISDRIAKKMRGLENAPRQTENDGQPEKEAAAPDSPEKKTAAATGYKTALPTTGDAVLDTLIPIAIVAGIGLGLAAMGTAIAQRTGRNDSD